MTRKRTAMEELAELYLFKYSRDMLTESQLQALDRMEKLAAEKLKEFSDQHGNANVGWMPEFQSLSSVPGHVRYLKENHANPFAKSAIDGSLETLRGIAKRFKFDLKG